MTLTTNVDVERARAQRVVHALTSPIFFAETYMRPYDPNWTTLLPAFGQDMLMFAARTKQGVILLPPEFMKTTLVSQVYALWRTVCATVEGEMLRGMLWSEEEKMATQNLSVMKWHILNNERIMADFSDAQGRPLLAPDTEEEVWRDDAIVVRRKGTSKDPTWVAKGLDSKGIHGRRLDCVIGDDVITPRNAASPALRQQALDTFDLVISTRIVKSGQVLMAGNFNDTKDLLHQLGDRRGWGMFKRPSMYVGSPDNPPKESELNEASLLWPENWDRSRLLTVYRATPNRFRRIHLMDPRAEHGERLSTEWVQLISPTDTPEHAAYVIGVDPAPGGDGDDLDFCTVTVLAVHRGHADVVESHAMRGSLASQVKIVGALHDRYSRMGRGVKRIGVSKVISDRYFQASLEMIRPDLKPRMEAIWVAGSKEERLEALGPAAQSGWLRVHEPVWERRTAGRSDMRQELTLAEEWRDFPFGTHDDRLDSIDLAIRVASTTGMVGQSRFKLRMQT